MTAKGSMLFGASGGVFIFNPDSIRKSSYVPPVVFSKLMVTNEEIVPGDKSLLRVDIDDTEQLVLSHKEDIHSFIRIRRMCNKLIFWTDLKNSGRLLTSNVM